MASFALGIYGFQNRRTPGGKAFTLLMAQTCYWCALAILILLATDLETKEFLTRARLLGIVFIGPTVALIASRIDPRSELYHRKFWQLAIFAPSVVFLICSWTPSLFDYNQHNFSLVDSWHLRTVRFDRGPLTQVQIGYNYLMMIYSYFLSLRMYLRGRSPQRQQAKWIVMGTLIPGSGDLLSMLMGWQAHWYHLTPAMSSAMVGCFAVAVFKYRLLDWVSLTKSQVFEKLPAPVLKLDEDRCVRVFNKSAAMVLGLSEKSLGRPIDDALADCDGFGSLICAEIKTMQKTAAPKHTVDFFSESPVQSTYWIIQLELTDNPTAKRPGLLITFQDITAQKNLEAAVRMTSEKLLQSNLRLENLLQFRSRLLSLVAHDLSGNIGTMAMVSSALYCKVGAEVDDSSQKMLRLLVRSSVTMQEFFSNLIQWVGKIDSDDSPQLKICDLRSLVEKSVNQLMPLLLAQDQKVEIRSQQPVFVAADPDMIGTVIRNLVSNAVAASERGSSIEIEYSDMGDSVWIGVKDNGIGISQEDLQKLLSQQRGLKSEPSPARSGFGIGLSLCHDFLSYHGSALDAESVPGQGSRFHFTLPKNPVGIDVKN